MQTTRPIIRTRFYGWIFGCIRVVLCMWVFGCLGIATLQGAFHVEHVMLTQTLELHICANGYTHLEMGSKCIAFAVVSDLNGRDIVILPTSKHAQLHEIYFKMCLAICSAPLRPRAPLVETAKGSLRYWGMKWPNTYQKHTYNTVQPACNWCRHVQFNSIKF